MVSGDSYEAAAHRELIEELGVDLEILPIAKYICREPYETEMVMLYKAVSNGPFKLNPSEIIQGKFFTRRELDKALKSGLIDLNFSAKVVLRKIGWIDF